MGDFPNLTACLNCRILYKPEQLRGPNCVKCGAKLQEAPEAIVRAKHRAKKKRQLEKRNSDPAATRKDKTLGKRSTTQKVDMATVRPVPRSRFQDKDSDGQSLSPIKKVASADELLSALESAPIPDENAPRAQKSPRRGGAKKKRTKKPDASLFIPLDTFVDKRGTPQVPGQHAAPDLFGASGQIGDSGITAQTEKARRGQIGNLEENVHFGDYELNQVLGRGGMGVVYKATQRSLGREVALKLMSSQNIADEDRIRFQREAKAAARLHHPHIVPIFDIGTHNGHDYFTLELIDGQDLHKLAMERQITERDAMEAVRKVALAIHYAHEQGVIHRDIKPHNILIDRNGEPHVTDFGLAKDLQDAVNLTTAGIALGSPPYMPPEQAMGNYDQVDAVSDVYGLGTILYECLAARPPFLGETPYEIIAKVQSQEPVAPSQYTEGVSKDAEVICLKAMDKLKTGRYQSAKELADDLERALNGEAILARPPTFTVKLARRLVKYRFQVASLAISLSVVLAMAIYALSVRAEGNRKKTTAPIDYREIATNQRGSAIDQSLSAARAGSFLEGIGLLSGAFKGQEVDRREWLERAREKISKIPDSDLKPLLLKALAKTSASSEGNTLQARQLLDSLASIVAEVPENSGDGYVASSVSLLELYMDSSFPNQTPKPNRDNLVLDRIAMLPSLMNQESGQARRGDGEVAKSLASVFLQAIRAGFSRQRGQVESARSLMIKVLAEDAPPQAILPFAEALVRLEGGKESPTGRLFLSRFKQSFANHPHTAVIKSLMLSLPPPQVDPSSGHIRALSQDYRSLLWRFPNCPLGKDQSKELLGSQELMRVADKAAHPTNPIRSIEGDKVYVGWLSFVYTIESLTGKVLTRLRVPARIHSLRSFNNGFLIATIIRSSGRATNEPKYEDILVDPNGGQMRRLIPGYGNSGPILPASHNVGFEPIVRQALQAEADSWLGWTTVTKKKNEIRDADARLRQLGLKVKARDKKLAERVAKLRGLAENLLAQSELIAEKDSRQPWLLLRRANLFKIIGDRKRTSQAADDAVVATSEVRNEYLTPFEEVAIAAELEEMGFPKHVDELLGHAFQTLIRDYRYVPQYAGFGENDPGQILSRLLDKLILRGRRTNKAEKKKATLERYQVIEAWRDAFAPALASSDSARGAKTAAFGESKVKAPEFPIALAPDSTERLNGGFANIGLGGVMILDILLFCATNYMKFFGSFVLILTCIGVYRRQRRDLKRLGYESFKESIQAWYTNPLLRLQHSFASYWTLRDRIGLCIIIFFFLTGLAVHDTILGALDAREKAPRPIFTGLLGHPQALEYLHKKVEIDGDENSQALLAYALAQSEERELSIALYSELAKVQSDPNAFNACLLREFGKLQGPNQKTELADKLDRLVDEAHPESFWARFALTRDKKAKESALILAPQRFALIDKFDTLRPVLIAPSREERDKVILGRSIWWTTFFENLVGMFLSTQDVNELNRACTRVLGKSQGTNQLVKFRTDAFFLVPAILLVVLASLLLPSRSREAEGPKAIGIRPIDYLFPGVAQLLRGYAPSGVILGSAFLFLVRYIAEGQISKIFQFEKLAPLVGETVTSGDSIFLTLKIFLILALLALFGVHALHLRRLSVIYGVAEADDSAVEVAAQTRPEPLLVDS